MTLSDIVESVVFDSDPVKIIGLFTDLYESECATDPAEWVGQCPFCHNQDRQFWVNRKKGVFHCFDCAASGDTIGFLQKKLGIAFWHVVERLSRIRFNDAQRFELEHLGRVQSGEIPSLYLFESDCGHQFIGMMEGSYSCPVCMRYDGTHHLVNSAEIPVQFDDGGSGCWNRMSIALASNPV